MTLPLEAGWPVLLVEVSLKGSVLLLAALVASRLLRHASAAMRHLVWVAALTGLLLIPVLAAVVPPWSVAVPPSAAFAPAFAAAPTAEAPLLDQRLAQIGSELAVPSTGAAPATGGTHDFSRVASADAAISPGLKWQEWLAWIWAVGATLILLRLLTGVVGLWWLSRRATIVTDAEWLEIAHRLAQRLGLNRAVTLLRGDRGAIPMTWGVLQPVVWLPAEADMWSSERREVVLAHELAHVHRRDVVTQWVAQFALALHWFNPLVWLAVQHLREERERACDDAVLALGMHPTRYAQHLLDIVRTFGTSSGPSPALAMARRSQFEGRLLAVLDRRVRRDGPGRRKTVFAVSILLCSTLPLAAISPVTAVATTSLAEDASPENAAVAAGPTSAELGRALVATSLTPDTLPLPSYGLGPRDGNHLHWSNGQGTHAEVRAQGKVEFSSDGAEIRRITPGGYLTVETHGQGSHRRIEVRPAADGELRYSYFVDGAQREWHESARAWLASVTTYLARSSTDELRLLEDEAQLRALEQTTFFREAPAAPVAPTSAVASPAPAQRSVVPTAPAAPPPPPAARPVETSPGSRTVRSVWNTRHELTGSHHGQPSFDLKIHATDVTLTPGREGVTEIGVGGSLVVEEERFAGDPDTPAPIARRLRVTPTAGGGLQYEYRLNGETRPFDAEARTWLGALLRKHSR